MSEENVVFPSEHAWLNRVIKSPVGLVLGVCVGYMESPSVTIKKNDGSTVTYATSAVVPMSEMDSLRYINDQLTAEVARLKDQITIAKAMRESEEYHSRPFEGRG